MRIPELKRISSIFWPIGLAVAFYLLFNNLIENAPLLLNGSFHFHLIGNLCNLGSDRAHFIIITCLGLWAKLCVFWYFILIFKSEPRAKTFLTSWFSLELLALISLNADLILGSSLVKYHFANLYSFQLVFYHPLLGQTPLLIFLLCMAIILKLQFHLNRKHLALILISATSMFALFMGLVQNIIIPVLNQISL